MDAGSGKPVQALSRADLACGAGAVGGPCDLSLIVHDALAFVSNPAGSTPLVHGAQTVDGCGRFRIADIAMPGTGIAAIVTDDASLAPENDLHSPSATFQSVGANAKFDDVDVLSSQGDTVTQWTQSAGSPFGANSFADVGAILLYFRAAGVARSGVTVVQNGNTVPANDYYFSDVSLLERLNIDSAQTTTGLNGSALFVNGTFGTYTGAGAEPLGCTWPMRMAASIPGVVVFVEIDC
jgi:hypothetical protein